MKRQGLDLSSYEQVKAQAGDIYAQVSTGQMPPGSPWSSDQVQTFQNWIKSGCPLGTPNAALEIRSLALAPRIVADLRIRKSIGELTAEELAILKSAFEYVMKLDPLDENSYYFQAAYHGAPVKFYCWHHVPGYNPWHRKYMLSFENALRSAPGCENVTLPYWDITTPFPEALKSPPFDKYVFQQDTLNYPEGSSTQRFDYDVIAQNLLQYQVTQDVRNAMAASTWEEFHGMFSPTIANDAIISAHDSGHVSIGPTMSKSGYASFDPVFWFFHCNLDRLWWEWQVQVGATDLDGLNSTIVDDNASSYELFNTPGQESLAPPDSFGTARDTIDSLALGVQYQTPAAFHALSPTPLMSLATRVGDLFEVHTEQVNVSVRGVDRVGIPGSFSLHLLRDGVVIASKGFFQAEQPNKCPTCSGTPVVNFDFQLPLGVVAGGMLSVEVEPVDKDFVGDRFPNKMMGNPTVEVRLLTSTD